MAEGHSALAIQMLAEPDTDQEELAELTFRLQAELLELDVAMVEPADSGPAPGDSKGLSAAAAGALVVRFALRADILRSVVSGVRSWARRQHVYSVKLTLDGDSLEITGPHSAAQDRAVDLWIARHANPG